MALLNRLFDNRGSEPETNESDIDYWCVRRMPFDGNGGFRSLDEWDEMDEPIDRQTFEWNHPDPDPGRYRLFAVQDSRYARPPEDVRWKWDVGDPSDSTDRSAATSDEVDSELAALREEVRDLKDSRHPPDADPEVIQARIRAKVMELALQNPHFMRVHGEKVALAAFDALSQQRTRPDYEEFEDAPIGATFYTLCRTMIEEPHKFRELGENLGAGVEGFFDGMAANTKADEGSTPDRSSQSPTDDATPNGWRPRDVDSGPATLDDLTVQGETDINEITNGFEEHPIAIDDTPDKHNGDGQIDVDADSNASDESRVGEERTSADDDTGEDDVTPPAGESTPDEVTESD